MDFSFGVYVISLSKAIIGINTMGINRIHNQKVRCLLNLFAISKHNIIDKAIKTGGTNIHTNHHPGLPQILNIRY